MDNKKIGKLISSLRKKNGLTQQELGDKVGVGFRAVSKWETGLTLPDIGIINELSQILGISSDELLSGELKPKEESNNTEIISKNKISKKIKITISIITSIIIIFTFLIIYLNNKTYVYNLTTENINDYYVEGQVAFKRNKMSIIINKIVFKNEKFASKIIKNYEYRILTKEKLLFGYGYINSVQTRDENLSIKDLMEKININSTIETKIDRESILKDNIILKLIFLDKENKEETKQIEIYLSNKTIK